MIFKELVNDFYISEQCCKMQQKMMQISNDLSLGREHNTNFMFLSNLVLEMDATIILLKSKGEETDIYEEFKSEVEKWIDKIFESKNSSSGELDETSS